jgi:hypothetical protein
MILNSRKTSHLIVGTIALSLGLLIDGKWTATSHFVSAAEARVGRPLTPMSYAGVARRTTRRAVVYGSAAAAAGAYAVTPGCAQVTDAYGRVYTRC